MIRQIAMSLPTASPVRELAQHVESGGERVVLRTADPEEHADLVARYFSIDKRPRGRPRGAYLAATVIAPLGELRFIDEVETHASRSDFHAADDHVLVHLVRSGTIRHIDADGTEAVYGGQIGRITQTEPGMATLTSDGHALRGILVPQRRLRRALEAATGRPAPGFVSFSPELDTRGGAGAALRRLIDLAASDLSDPAGVLQTPAAARAFEELFVGLLLDHVDHDRMGLLALPVGTGSEAAVRRVEDYIEAHAGEPLSLADLAAVAGCSTRSLQLAFRRHRDTTPMARLRRARLEGAQEDLLGGLLPSVTEVALRWQFVHLGDFARHYREAFGELPSETSLRVRDTAARIR